MEMFTPELLMFQGTIISVYWPLILHLDANANIVAPINKVAKKAPHQTHLALTSTNSKKQTKSVLALCHIEKHNQDPLLPTINKISKPVPACVDKNCPEVKIKEDAISLSRWVLKENEEDEYIIFYEGEEEERKYMDSLQDCRTTNKMIDSQVGQTTISPLIIFSEVHVAQAMSLFENFFAENDILCSERRKVDIENRCPRLGRIRKPPDKLNIFLLVEFVDKNVVSFSEAEAIADKNVVSSSEAEVIAGMDVNSFSEAEAIAGMDVNFSFEAEAIAWGSA
ncbi:hypothetical protein BpHYR1_027587 [Brachionus plicatilis]|uniref:Uncharacterized protein n=1 Tax=Brachionus plicatilis TaxID=10195 RepID=A0A3M7PHX0_BRAPC|nr:hypothetical protein BpHYR1_027587 [Brachionus plicatilis]